MVLAEVADGNVGELSSSETAEVAEPTTVTVPVAVCPPPDAVTVIVRAVVFEPSDRAAVTVPVALVIAGLTAGVITPEVAENVTVTFFSALLFASTAVAVTVIGVVDVEEISVLLNVSDNPAAVAVPVVGVVAVLVAVPAEPPPPPQDTSVNASTLPHTIWATRPNDLPMELNIILVP